jgi:cytoskeletal protein CcmA (bactofilin family)
MAQIGLKQLDSVLTGSLQVSGSLGVTGSLELENTSTVGVGDTYIDFTTGDEINFWAGGERLLSIDESATDEVVVGDGGHVNFRAATAGYGYNLYVKSDNAGGVDNSVGIRTQSPQSVLDVTGDLKVSSHVTASANISSSGTVTAEHFYSSDDALIDGTVTSGYSNVGYSLTVNTNAHGGGDFRVKSVNNDYQIFSDSNQDKVGIGHSSPPTLTSVLTVGGDITATHITASGNVSASGTVYASNFESAGSAGEIISFNDNLNITGHITASGDINTTAGRVYEAGTSVIDHATAMAIVFGG